MADVETRQKEAKDLKNKPPPESIERTAKLMRGLLAVPKAEIDEQAKQYAKARKKKRRTSPHRAP